jgi:DNA-directed RNA polymerase subunit RPC12/RpoP
MEHNLHYINCPICGMQLVELFGEGSEYNYHCTQCHIDITIDTGEEDEEGE